jgi:hypothetical protein
MTACFLNNSKKIVCTSEETHYISITQTNWLILFGRWKKNAVYWENHTKQTNTFSWQNVKQEV